MRLELPYPPSANRYWRKTNRGHLYPSEEAKAFKAAVLRLCQDCQPLAGPVVVRVDVYRPQKSGDLDNTLKVLLDSLKGLAFTDDKQVTRIEAERFDDKANPRAVVTIEERAA